MPIEFHCPKCDQLLRTPDGTAGKQAKCPQCGQIVSIPLATDAAVHAYSMPPPQYDDAHAAVNPYASSQVTEVAFQAARQTQELRPTRLELSTTLSRTWAAYKPTLGIGVLFSLIIIGIQFVNQLTTTLIGLAVAAMFNAIPGQVASIIVQQLWAQCVGALVACITITYGLNVARGSHASPLDGIFSVGRYYLRILGFNLLLTLLVPFFLGLLALPFLAPVFFIFRGADLPALGTAVVIITVSIFVAAYVVIWCMLFFTNYFIVDRNMTMSEAMSASLHYSRGNRLTIFATLLVAGVLGILFVLATCLIGFLFVLPYFAVLAAVMYFSATGQWSTDFDLETAQ